MTTFSLVETMSGRSHHVLFDHHVAETAMCDGLMVRDGGRILSTIRQ
ncbi:hypothetical protein Rleg2_4603 (plasmid) [Rhizobium leguminosarum bv. trifolii WSM2304]|uniref:Uncharacterized protein n=1 Tax=Rhizobium leguminosarum bv. trifolii (strain WSM2304) TaxID=395492 RepID=A0ABF7QUI5_RHILW|nr:hypothetical protein Rleg2_4603 [Rhizobium leguminosarum bv. trifolii WSM2304]